MCQCAHPKQQGLPWRTDAGAALAPSEDDRGGFGMKNGHAVAAPDFGQRDHRRCRRSGLKGGGLPGLHSNLLKPSYKATEPSSASAPPTLWKRSVDLRTRAAKGPLLLELRSRSCRKRPATAGCGTLRRPQGTLTPSWRNRQRDVQRRQSVRQVWPHAAVGLRLISCGNANRGVWSISIHVPNEIRNYGQLLYVVRNGPATLGLESEVWK